MNVHGKPFRTIWIDENDCLTVIDQRTLPHRFEVLRLPTFSDLCEAIANMTVRGAGLIGATAGYGMWLAVREGLPPEQAAAQLIATRPTAANLKWAVQRQLATLEAAAGTTGATGLYDTPARCALARTTAQAIADEDAAFCRRIGEHGLEVIRRLFAAVSATHANQPATPVRPLNILTHCNAGWLAFVDFGSALSPVYAAHNAGLPVHVWVDETRPRNQGACLTAWELAMHGVPHTLIADNAGGHLMQQGMVDMVIVGADRVARNGDTANKIGTYLKALAAYDNNVPFYVALPSSTFDFALKHGGGIPIEQRGEHEVRHMEGKDAAGRLCSVQICPDKTPAGNWAFDVTPARLITGLICERGLCPASEQGIAGLFSETGHD